MKRSPNVSNLAWQRPAHFLSPTPNVNDPCQWFQFCCLYYKLFYVLVSYIVWVQLPLLEETCCSCWISQEWPHLCYLIVKTAWRHTGRTKIYMWQGWLWQTAWLLPSFFMPCNKLCISLCTSLAKLKNWDRVSLLLLWKSQIHSNHLWFKIVLCSTDHVSNMWKYEKPHSL